MQLVNTIDIPLENDHFLDRKVQAFGNMLLRETAGIWHRLREALSEISAIQRPCTAPDAINFPGYYGGAYHRVSAAMPIVACSAIIGQDPFQPASTSPRRTIAALTKKGTPQSHGGEDIWLDILRADPALPARMM